MSTLTRRMFLSDSRTLFVGAVALAAGGAHAAEEHSHGSAGDGLAIPATDEDTCATCLYWGGMRKLSEDGKAVIAQSMGWCNNPDSPNHRKLTAADHRMKKADTWKRWPAL